MKTLLKAAFVAAALAAATPSIAQENYPEKPVTIIVPFPPGGPTDTIMRTVGEALSQHWDQPVVVENKPGGGTIVGTSAVDEAEPDGYTIGAAVGPYVTVPAVRENLPYNALEDFRGVSMIAEEFLVLVAHESVEASNIEELVALAEESDTPLTYATPSTGGTTHLAGVLLQRTAGIELQQIPYNGSAPAMTDLLAGRVQLMFGIWHSLRPHVEKGTLKLIGVVNPTKLADAPEYQTISEVYPDYGVRGFEGFYVSSDVSDEIVNEISQAVQAVVETPELAEKLRSLGAKPVGSSAEEFDAFLKQEITRWTELAEEEGISIE